MYTNSFNPKYDLMMFSTYYGAWKRVSSCMTLKEGHDLAENYI